MFHKVKYFQDIFQKSKQNEITESSNISSMQLANVPSSL